MLRAKSTIVVLWATVSLAGCASLPPDRGYSETSDLVEARLGAAPTWSGGQKVDTVTPTEKLDVQAAILFAFAHNPQIRQEYARLGLGRADLEQARRISNPSVTYSKLDVVGGAGVQITRGAAVLFSDLLLLPSRTRLAQGELDRLQTMVAARLLALASEVEIAWFKAVGADQVASMRELAALAAERSFTLAQRFFDAGNIGDLQLQQERAQATLARIDAVRADANALRARAQLAGLLGLSTTADWRTDDRLPAPLEDLPNVGELVDLALQQRLDLSAARQNVALREDVLGVTRRWRWLGSVDLEFERESETDGGRLEGPAVGLELPLFDQGQAEVLRADAELIDARAELDAQLLHVANEARMAVEQLATHRDIADRYRRILVPAREAIVARMQEQVNFMLKGVFELIVSRREEYNAYQEYLESVQDYWISRAELRRIVGGRLPDDDRSRPATIGVEAMGAAAVPADMGHANGHAGHGPATDARPAPHSAAADDNNGEAHTDHQGETP